MSGLRRHAARVLLAWMGVGAIFAAGAGHSEASPTPLPPCHAAAPADAGTPSRAPAPGTGLPCQWILPLFCCQQPAAADAANTGPVPPAALWIRSQDAVLQPSAPLLRAAATALRVPYDPLPERSVVLQI